MTLPSGADVPLCLLCACVCVCVCVFVCFSACLFVVTITVLEEIYTCVLATVLCFA